MALKVMTTTYPIKAPLYAITKATNYLPNVLACTVPAASRDRACSHDVHRDHR